MDKDHEFWNFGKISVRSGWHFGELPMGSVHPFTGCIHSKNLFVALALLLYLAVMSNSIAFTDETYCLNGCKAIGRWTVKIC
jgi:hypothetical protein